MQTYDINKNLTLASFLFKGHNISADYWSFGILIYELLTKTTPFYAANDMEIYEGILNGIEGVRFSRKVGKHAEVIQYSLVS